MEMETEMGMEMEMEMEMEMQTHSSLSPWLAVPVIARSTSAPKFAVPFEFCYRSAHELRTAVTEKGCPFRVQTQESRSN